MNEQENPFLYGRPIERADELIDREGEQAELLDSVRSGQPVMVYGPRRYGKTSLARVVERDAADVVGVLDRAYARVSGVFRVRRFLADLLGSTSSPRPGTWRRREQRGDPSRPIPCWPSGSASG